MSLITFSLSSLDSCPSSASKGDRFIPSRSDFEEFADTYKPSNRRPTVENEDQVNDENQAYSKLLKTNLKMNQPLKKPSKTQQDLQNEDLGDKRVIRMPEKLTEISRKIPKTPFKVLDAPNLQDDFYLNVVDWSKSDVLAVGLGICTYTWSFQNNKVEKIMSFEENCCVSGVTWDQKSDYLCVGSNTGAVQIWDINKHKKIRDVYGHKERVGSLSYQGNLLLTGSRDKNILMHDLRTAQTCMSFPGHKQEVCGLRWSPDGQYFASGGNDNKLFVFSPKMQIPIMKKNHKAAVKAIAWNERNPQILATGSGTADRCIRLWNIQEKKLIDFKDTGSQICNIAFSRLEDEIITTHGFSNNEICIWQMKGLKKISTLVGHTSRVLYLATDPKGEHIVTGAGDETLRFWNLGYDNSQKQSSQSQFDHLKTLR